ncbi:Protein DETOXIFICATION 16 [Ranunculus cassubicifolius]
MEEESKPELGEPLVPSHERILEFGAEENLWRSKFLVEAQTQLWLAGPLIVVSLLQYSLQVISIMFIGHLGELSLSSASIATSFASVTGFNLLLGMGTALETLCGQAYGAKQNHMLGVHMQRAMLCLSIASIPLAILWSYTSQILIAVGQNPEISTGAGVFIRWMIPSLFAYGLLQCIIRFLQTQNIVFPMVITSGITILVHIPLCWILVFKSGLGYRGAALANTISYWINAILLMVYVKCFPGCKTTWNGFSKEALYDVPNFLKLAIPSAIMICLEYWAFEMVVLLSGLLPNPKLETSVLSISLNSCWLVYTISVGLGGAVSTRVSNELGAGNPRNARLALHVMATIALIEGITVATITVLARRAWGKLYSNEEEVVEYTATMLPLLALSNFLDGIQCVLSGAARGCGWQNVCSVINLGSYYGVGIPSAVLFAFVLHIGGQGLWMGIICALSVELLMLVIINLRTNWDDEARKAMSRVYSFDVSDNLS